MSSSKIKTIHAREILDSRGEPTIETKIILDNGVEAKAAVPSGASVGKYEAIELRDQDPKRYSGKGVLKACENVNTILSKELSGLNVLEQKEIDHKMINLDGTPNKANLGANAILSVSLASARAAAQSQNLELWQWLQKLSPFETNQNSFNLVKKINQTFPLPCFNVVNGGKHANNHLKIQEFWILPVSAQNFREAARMGSEVFHSLREICEKNNYGTGVGDEGGLSPALDENAEAIELILEAITKANYEPGADFALGIDAAASNFYTEEKYLFNSTGLALSAEEMVNVYKEWVRKYPIISIEDGLAEEDWTGWQNLTSSIGSKIQIIGDDLLVTNTEKLQKAISEKAANSILIKLNQIGTLSETLDCINLAQKNNFGVVVSHRSGETCDTFISDLAFAVGANQIKTGSLCRGERLAKYNRLMEIEEMKNRK